MQTNPKDKKNCKTIRNSRRKSHTKNALEPKNLLK